MLETCRCLQKNCVESIFSDIKLFSAQKIGNQMLISTVSYGSMVQISEY